MDIEYAIEPINVVLGIEIDALLKRMYEDTVASTNIPPYKFDWERYEAVERAGMLMVATARSERMLAGFAIYTVVDHPHHKGTRTSECDAIAVDTELRGARIGSGLIEYALERLRDRGAVFVTHRYRTCYETQPVFPKLGFRLVEHVYMKDL